MRRFGVVVVSVLVIANLGACKKASFGWFGKKKGKQNNEQVQNPNNVGPQNPSPGEQIPAPPPVDTGFRIAASPDKTDIGRDINFSSSGCDTDQVRWLMGDGMAANGVNTVYKYKIRGTFKVEATCTKADAQILKAETTVYIMPITSIPSGGAVQSASQTPGGQLPGSVQY